MRQAHTAAQSFNYRWILTMSSLGFSLVMLAAIARSLH